MSVATALALFRGGGRGGCQCPGRGGCQCPGRARDRGCIPPGPVLTSAGRAALSGQMFAGAALDRCRALPGPSICPFTGRVGTVAAPSSVGEWCRGPRALRRSGFRCAAIRLTRPQRTYGQIAIGRMQRPRRMTTQWRDGSGSAGDPPANDPPGAVGHHARPTKAAYVSCESQHGDGGDAGRHDSDTEPLAATDALTERMGKQCGDDREL